MAEKNIGKHDDFRRMVMEDFDGIDDVFKFDSSLEALIYGQNVTETIDQQNVSIPVIKRSY